MLHVLYDMVPLFGSLQDAAKAVGEVVDPSLFLFLHSHGSQRTACVLSNIPSTLDKSADVKLKSQSRHGRGRKICARPPAAP